MMLRHIGTCAACALSYDVDQEAIAKATIAELTKAAGEDDALSPEKVDAAIEAELAKRLVHFDELHGDHKPTRLRFIGQAGDLRRGEVDLKPGEEFDAATTEAAALLKKYAKLLQLA